MLFLPAKGLIQTDGSHHSVFGLTTKKEQAQGKFFVPGNGTEPKP
jgi:hypothetical protein